jgi:hypothetical protein
MNLNKLSPQDQEALSKVIPLLQDWMSRPALSELAKVVIKQLYPATRFNPRAEIPPARQDALDTFLGEGSGTSSDAGILEIN